MSSTPHIFTLTGNLLAERTFEFAAWAAGKTQRATHESFQVGGKGINVSKMLNRLGAANTALCFTGGAPGAECEHWLRSRSFSFKAFATERATRVGTVVRAKDRPETTFLGPDAAPSATALAACADFLNAQPDGQLLAICGSIPGWRGAEFDPLRGALERWMQRGILVADTYGPPLAWFAQRPLALVKINAVELQTLYGDVPVPDVLATVQTRSPVLRWVVSDGPRAVWFREREHSPEQIVPPTLREVSATGSGDVLLASLLSSLFCERLSLRAAVERAIPLAAANAAHGGIAEFP